MLGLMHTSPDAGITSVSQVRPPALRILVADDCRVNRMLVHAVLRRWGLVPIIACNGQQAVQLAAAQEFDLVLMDILMPVMDGIAATARIRQNERENLARRPVPIVAYTSLELRTDGTQLERVGLSAVLAKPCSSTSMQLCLERWCPDKFRPGGH